MWDWWGHRRADGGGSKFSAAADDVRAEIEDHLAASAAEFQRSGLPSDKAWQEARQRFGDVERIERRCTWIQMGDQIMLRAVLIVTLVVLTLGLVTVGIGTWRLENSLSDRMDVIADQLAAMNRVQQTVVQRISGHLYLRDKNMPAANVEVAIGGLLDGKIVNRLVTDDRGEFHSAPLPAGDYFVLVPLQGAANTNTFYIQSASGIGGFSGGYVSTGESTPRYHIQSGPLHVYPGMEPPHVELDVTYYHSDIRFGLNRPVPDVIQVGNKRVDVGIKLVLRANELQSLPWTSSSSVLPDHWPLVAHAFGKYTYQFDQFTFPEYLVPHNQAANLPPLPSMFATGASHTFWANPYMYTGRPNEQYERWPMGTYSVAAAFYFLPTEGGLVPYGDELLPNIDYQRLFPLSWSSAEEAHDNWAGYSGYAAAFTALAGKVAKKTGRSAEELRRIYRRRQFLSHGSSAFSDGARAFPAPEQLRQVQVVDGHETVIEIQFPEGLEEAIRGALSQTELNAEELSELLAARVAELVVQERPMP
jgi:hypothetical protein